MAVTVEQIWETVGHLPDGSAVRMTKVLEKERVIGRVVDLGGNGFYADFVGKSGDVEEVLLPDYYSAVLRVAEEFWDRQRRLH